MKQAGKALRRPWQWPRMVGKAVELIQCLKLQDWTGAFILKT